DIDNNLLENDFPLNKLKKNTLKSKRIEKTAKINLITNSYIYMLQEREFVKTQESIYKIGHTSRDISKRFSEYPKDSKLLFCCPIDKCVVKECENKLIHLLKSKFKQRSDIGTEYFEGNQSIIIKDIINYIQTII
ncbi:MAG: GIY-YIG nuclease family protein, partial [Magnetovibrio sp.]|nr:GIY-YIG nuclease family protein [Magnetovibrio sp.]